MVRRKTEPPRGILKTAVAEPRRYRYERYHASPDLDRYVEHYWAVEWDLRGQEPELAETLPHRIAGASRARFSRLLEGAGGVFAVKFRPGGFHPLVRVPVSRFSNTTARLRDVFGGDGDALDAAILAERTDAGRIAVVERFLRARRPQPDDNAALAGEIVYAVARERGILKVHDLVARYGIGARALQRMFARYVGVSPKWVIQRYRLHEAAEQLGAATPVDQASLALHLGYSDQAHFIRDFKAIVGVTPAAYARASRR
jgi:AraC-like DNA-binding protein